MSAPAREPGSSPVRPVSPFSSPRPPSPSACGTFRRPSPQGGSLLLRACEPEEGREHWSRALDPLQHWAERDGTARPRARALSGRLGPGWLERGVPPSGRGSEDFFSHPLLERVRVPPCTRARSGCPGQSARCGAAGLTVLLVGSSHIVFKVASQVPSRSVRLHRSSGVPQSSLSFLGSPVTGNTGTNRRGSCPKEVDTPTSRSCGSQEPEREDATPRVPLGSRPVPEMGGAESRPTGAAWQAFSLLFIQ